MKEYSMTSIAPTVSKLLGIKPPAQSVGVEIKEVVKDLGSQEKVFVLAVDAFGVSTWERAKDLTPNFNKLAQKRLLHIRSVVPAITPVNFATMATGAPPEAHGIKDRSELLKLETVFHVAAKSSLTSAAAGRALSTVGMLLMRFAEHKCVAQSNTDEELNRLAIKTVREESPNFMLMQLLDVDDIGHKDGLEGEEIRTAAAGADRHLGELIPHLAESGYALLVLADHGAHQVDGKATHSGAVEDDLIVPLVWCDNRRLGKL